ncbi:cytochrome B2 [Colletotrichum tofieldiae]|nr:cytochrome B2 [Colletotrichum tofieldiae]
MTTKTQETGRATISLTDLRKHNQKTDCWIAVHSKVWDITDFISEHPGGPSVLLRCAGSNATKIFDEVHAPDILEELPDEKFIGTLKDATPDVPAAASQPTGSNGVDRAVAETAQTSLASAQGETLVHPDGELALSRGAANEGIIQCISSNASYSLKSIISAAPPTQPFFFQLYINSERHKTIEILRSARSLGVKAIFVTVDAPVPGKREADERAAQAGTIRAAISGAESSRDKKGSGLGRLMAQYIDKSITWEDLTWIREASGVPIVLKGVQTADDVRLAVEYGLDGVLLSNHGGRSLDGSQASILVLLEIREQCPDIFDKMEIYIDGGFERGSDILKAIALGATAVGVGRPFLYSLMYGQEGVEHLSQILKDELETSMRLCGVTSLKQVTPAMVNTLDVDYLVISEERSRQKKPLRRPRSKL